ncbi:hypothetical protein [Mesoterricola sediminis]|uniref:Uncharacterized protein n=1 Tax=Mesoterricola sediminis TaxID=2927980 RepID=A0AA48H299_9BACT|nr:hypothetical protein [Mesoterricola sediminis]BDU78660.1 hypothetical protein METESE_36180 [Mesoterricola sediminis]
MNKTFLLLPLLAAALACGGGGSPSAGLAPVPAPTPAPNPEPGPTTVVPTLGLSPQALTARVGSVVAMPIEFTASSEPVSLTGYSFSATWVDTGATQAIGNITPSGTALATFTAPALPGTHTLSVKAAKGQLVTAAVPVEVTLLPEDPGAVLQITPSAARVAPGKQVVFAAKGTSDPGTVAQFTLNVVEPDGGTITRLNRVVYAYQAPEAPGTYHLVLQKVGDGTQVTAEVTVAAPAP